MLLLQNILGNDTMCQKIVEEYGYTHLSAGELLRLEQNTANSPHGELIKKHMVSGTIVPVAITCSLLLRAMIESNNDRFLVDGFPRNQDNLNGWVKEINPEEVNVTGVLNFSCEPSVSIDRCLKRGAKGSGRSDDEEEVLKKRFVTHTVSTLPIVEYYRKMGIVFEINANETVDTMYNEIKSKFVF